MALHDDGDDEDADLVLSEVHLGLPVSSTASNVLSRFVYHSSSPAPGQQKAVPGATVKTVASPLEQESSGRSKRSAVVEELEEPHDGGGDGGGCGDDAGSTRKILKETTQDAGPHSSSSRGADDQSPPRRVQPSEVILVEHWMATSLPRVGLQVWPAALLMADFLLQQGEQWKQKTVLELGGGVGLCGIVAATVARRVICTDYLADIVEVMERNFRRNSRLLHAASEYEYECRVLDVRSTPPESLPVCDVVIASDVIYNGDLTEALLRFVRGMLARPPQAAGRAEEFLLAFERRLNFTVVEKRVLCPAYEYFVDCCHRFGLSRQVVNIEQTPKRFQYERSAYLELHRVTLDGGGRSASPSS